MENKDKRTTVYFNPLVLKYLKFLAIQKETNVSAILHEMLFPQMKKSLSFEKFLESEYDDAKSEAMNGAALQQCGT